ncbi:MAG TPA: EamA family transporter [Cyclobacteriaceae bacterium]|nr:EamA family transporter [Cyclobacteriaceae bacterium]
MNLNFTSSKNSWLAYAALAVICVLWGTTFLGIRIGVMDIPPFLFAALRLATAGLILTGFMLIFGKAQLPSKKVMLTQALAGFSLFTLGNGLIGVAELHISSGITAIICSMIPIWVTLINLGTSADERPTLPVFLGLAIGLSGIVLMFGDNLSDFSNPAYLGSLVVIFIANMGWSFGSVWIKRKNANSNSNTFVNAGLQMFFGGMFLFIASFIFDDYSTLRWTAPALWSLVYLIVFGSVISFACFSYAVKKLPITIVSLYAYINPIVAVLLGTLILNEAFNFRIAVAMLVTVAGVYIVNKGFQLRDLWRAQFSR